MRLPRLGLAAVLAVAAGLVPSGVARADAPACTTSFIPATGAWEDAASWTAGVPTATSVVCWTADQTVTVSTGDQVAQDLQGGALVVTGGSLTVGPAPGTYDAAHVSTLTATGGTITGFGAGPTSLGGDVTVGSLGPLGATDIPAGSAVHVTHLVEVRDVLSIEAKDVVTEGAVSIAAPTFAFGPDVTLAHLGSGKLTLFVYPNDPNQAPRALRILPGGDITVEGEVDGSVEVPDTAAFHAAAIETVCSGSPHDSFRCSEVVGAGTVDVRTLDTTVQASNLRGPVTIARTFGQLDVFIDPGSSTHLSVANGPLTLDGRIAVHTSGYRPPAGTTFTLIDAPAGLTVSDRAAGLRGDFRAVVKPTAYSLVAGDPSTITATVEPASVTPTQSYDVHVTVTGTVDVPDGGSVSVSHCYWADAHGNGLVGAVSAPVVDGVATVHVDPATSDCQWNASETGQQQLAVWYSGDDAGTYGHTSSHGSAAIFLDRGPDISPSPLAEPAKPVCAAPAPLTSTASTVRRARAFRVTGAVLLDCPTPPFTPAVPYRVRVDLLGPAAPAGQVGRLVGYLAVDRDDQHVHGWAKIPPSVRPGRYVLRVAGASKDIPLTVRAG